MSEQHPEDEDHHGQDGGRETLTAGEAQRADALGPGGEQTMPAMSQNNASVDDKVAGIVAQTRVDVGREDLDRIADVLRQRLDDAGIDLSQDEVAALAREVKGGAGGGGGSGV